jgi:hypothetical protein
LVLASNVVAEPATFNKDVTMTLGVTNNLPLQAGATAAPGQTIQAPTFDATTDYKHSWTDPTRIMVGRAVVNFAAGASLTAENTQLALGTSTLPMTISIGKLPRGYIQTINVGTFKISGPITVQLKRLVGSTPTLESSQVVPGSGPGGVTFTAPTPTSWISSDVWYLLISGGGTNGDELRTLVVNVSNPP